MWFAHVLPHSLDCLYILLTVCFTEQESLILMLSKSFIFHFMNCALGLLSKKPLPSRRSPRFFSPFYLLRVFVLHFKFRSMIHFELILWMVSSLCLDSLFLWGCPVFLALLIEKTIFASLYYLCSFIKDLLTTIFLWIYVFVLCFVPLIYFSLFFTNNTLF